MSTADPVNLVPVWVHFNYDKSIRMPVKFINDAAMQALGSYEGGTMLFLGVGTGLGTALIVNGTVVPMELGHLLYKEGTFETYLGLTGLTRLGITKWRETFRDVATRLIDALELDDVVVGGGNVSKLNKLPPRCRAGDNALAFRGGFLLWEEDGHHQRSKRSTKPARS